MTRGSGEREASPHGQIEREMTSCDGNKIVLHTHKGEKRNGVNIQGTPAVCKAQKL